MRSNRLGHLYKDGDVIFHKGEEGNSMFLIQKGSVEIILDEEKNNVINTLTDGEFFGEMSLLTRQPRSATLRSALLRSLPVMLALLRLARQRARVRQETMVFIVDPNEGSFAVKNIDSPIDLGDEKEKFIIAKQFLRFYDNHFQFEL